MSRLSQSFEDDRSLADPGAPAPVQPLAAEGRSRDLLAHFERAHARSAAWRGRLMTLVEEHAAIESELHQVIAEALQLREMANHHSGAALDLRRVLENYERTLILWALACTGGRQDRAAAVLGLGPSTLGAKIKRLAITVVSTNATAPDGGEA